MAMGTVLYVEDEENDVLFMETAFRKAGLGLALRSVPDGREAINYLAGNGPYADRAHHPLPAVLLLDLNLPLVPGFEVLAWLRTKAEFKELPVVVFSSSPREQDKSKALELGAQDFWVKPQSVQLYSHVVQGLKERWLDPEGAGPRG